MKSILLFFLLSISKVFAFSFEDYFFDKTMRLDFYHLGNKNEEMIIFHNIYEEEYWGGSKINLLDTIGFGNYFFKIFDKQSESLIYSRGFSSLFQEWQSTEEARTNDRIFNETIIFPFPKNEVIIKIYRRDRRNNFIEKFSRNIDPKSIYINRESKSVYSYEKMFLNSKPEKALDIAIIPEGYTKDEMDKFKDKVKEFSDYLISISPFNEFKEKINFWIVYSPSIESGCDIPGSNIWKNTIVNSSFYTFESERYLMSLDMWKIRDIASTVPYDQIFILVNTDKYGGGGIYNYYSIISANNPLSAKVFAHEFGHGFVGLADEYGDDPTYIDYYPSDIEPWEPNITTLANFSSKWKRFLDSSTPVPTPNDEKYKNVIGVFEGAGYASENVYRSSYDSIMRTLKSNEFNRVCQEAIKKMLKFYTE